MTSAPVRDPLADHLLTPQNAALLLIDYQPSQLAGVHSMDRDLLVKNAPDSCGSRAPRQPASDPATAEREHRIVHINVHLRRQTQT